MKLPHKDITTPTMNQGYTRHLVIVRLVKANEPFQDGGLIYTGLQVILPVPEFPLFTLSYF